MSWHRVRINRIAPGQYLQRRKHRGYLLDRRAYMIYRATQVLSCLFAAVFLACVYYNTPADTTGRWFVVALAALVLFSLSGNSGWQRLTPEELARYEAELEDRKRGKA